MNDRPKKTPEEEAAALRELLAQHQEISRLQGNHLDAVTRELGETQAKLRAVQEENRRLHTQLSALGPKKITP